MVRSGFPNTYLTFYKGSTEEYFRVADKPPNAPTISSALGGYWTD